MSDWFDKESLRRGLKKAGEVGNKLVREVDAGITLAREQINELPISVSRASVARGKVEDDDAGQYDEKHYFVVPFLMSPHGFALHTLRSLPDGVQDINDLPKRRVFHFARPGDEALLLTYMQEMAREMASDDELPPNSLISLADSIDSLDKKLTYGMLLVGGLAAVVNPLLGAGIAAKALLPSVGGLASKYGLRPVADKLQQWRQDSQVQAAQEQVTGEFAAASTRKVINPLLAELACRAGAAEPRGAQDTAPEIMAPHWPLLTASAMGHVYQEMLADGKLPAQASLSVADIDWLRQLPRQ